MGQQARARTRDVSAAARGRRVGPAAAATVVALAAALAACGGGDRVAMPPGAASPTAFEDAGPGPGAGAGTAPAPGTVPASGDTLPNEPLIRVRAGLTGTSADADEIDLALDWHVSARGVDALGPDTRLEAVLTGADGARRTLARTRVPENAPEGRIEITLAVPLGGALGLELTGLRGVRADDPAARTAVDLPAVVAPAPTSLADLESLSASLVPGSASSRLEGERRVHRFSVRVAGALGAGAPLGYGTGGHAAHGHGAGEGVAVTGLERDVGEHFLVWENGYVDPESPVRAAWRGEPIHVYLVLDASASIALAGADGALRDAVSRTVSALAPVATFDYRAVASRVRPLTDLRELEFDDGSTGSGTAFHHAVDTALDDIEAMGRTGGRAHSVIIGFTDGRDFASRNFYPSLGSDAEVLERVVARLARVRAERAADGAPFEAHFASLGSDVDVGALDALASAGGGRHVSSRDVDALGGAFSALAAGLRGTYRLEYSSQRRAGDGPLALEVRAAGLSARVPLP